ncbi:MAG: hypothetical protein ACREGR_04730 [Minisyncoccia bacterium]
MAIIKLDEKLKLSMDQRLALAQAGQWEYETWYDLELPPGCFVSPTYDDYEYNGEVIRALNWLHAEYTYWHRQIEKSGGAWGACCHCGRSIRYAVICKDKDGHHHMVGQDCAGLVLSGLDESKWYEQKLLSEIKEIDTKRGRRAVLSFKLEEGHWYWDIPRDKRPSFCSLRKWEKPTSTQKRPEFLWFLSIWGNTPGEVVENLAKLRSLNKDVKTVARQARQVAQAEAARLAALPPPVPATGNCPKCGSADTCQATHCGVLIPKMRCWGCLESWQLS